MKIENKQSLIARLLAKGQDLCSSEEFQEALRVFDEVLKIDSRRVDALHFKAFSLFSLGRYIEAAIICDEILNIDPTDARAVDNRSLAMQKGHLYSIKGQEGSDLLDELVKHNPGNANTLAFKGDNLREQGKYEEAFDYYNKTLQIDPSNELSICGKAVALTKLDRHQEVLEFLSDLCNHGKFQEVLNVSDELIKIDPKHVGALNAKGLAQMKSRKLKEALEIYNQVLSIDSRNVVALTNKGTALALLGNVLKAIEAFDEALKIDPRSLATLRQKEKAFFVSENYEGALEVCNEILRIDPKDVMALENKDFAKALIPRFKFFDTPTRKAKRMERVLQEFESARILSERLEKTRIEDDQRRVLLQEQRVQAKEDELQRIEKIKQDIRAMPRYAVWRQDVLARYGRRCAVGGFKCSTDNLEVDHFPKSLHSLVVKNGLQNAGIQAYECVELWDINNGAVICKEHHDQTTSSRYRASKL